MFNLINKLSHDIAESLSSTDLTNDNYDYYQLSTIALLSFSFYSIVAIIISVFIGYFQYILLIIAILLSLRSPSGGAHANNSTWCLIATSTTYIIIGISLTLLYKYYLFIFILSFLFSLTGLDKVPKYTKTHPRHKIEKQNKFRKKYIITLCIFLLLNIIGIILLLNNIQYFLCFDLIKINILISMCVLVNRFNLTDFASRIFDMLK